VKYWRKDLVQGLDPKDKISPRQATKNQCCLALTNLFYKKTFDEEMIPAKKLIEEQDMTTCQSNKAYFRQFPMVTMQ
jgi:hypothetical protein